MRHYSTINELNVLNEKRKSNKSSVAFFERGSWYHRVKTLEHDYSVKYSKIGGFSTQQEAEEDYWKCEEDFVKAQTAAGVKTSTDLNLGDYLVYWFENEFSSRVETTTRMVMAYTLYDLFLPSMLGDIKMSLLSVDYLDALLERASISCASAGNKCRELLSIALKDATINGYIKSNPVPNTKPYKRKKPNVKILNKAQIKDLLKVAQQDNWYLEILLGLFCGLRKGEILGLKFCDFNIENKTVKITRQLVANPVINSNTGSSIDDYGLIERDPKTPNSVRVLRLPEVVMTELENRRSLISLYKEKLGKNYNDHDYISCQKNGNPHSLAAMNISLKKLCMRNGIPLITVHGLRHMYATILIENGVSLAKISGLLGHSSIHTTFEYYCDVMEEFANIKAFMNNTFIPE